jgi:hypothetical protein
MDLLPAIPSLSGPRELTQLRKLIRFLTCGERLGYVESHFTELRFLGSYLPGSNIQVYARDGAWHNCKHEIPVW